VFDKAFIEHPDVEEIDEDDLTDED